MVLCWRNIEPNVLSNLRFQKHVAARRGRRPPFDQRLRTSNPPIEPSGVACCRSSDCSIRTSARGSAVRYGQSRSYVRSICTNRGDPSDQADGVVRSVAASPSRTVRWTGCPHIGRPLRSAESVRASAFIGQYKWQTLFFVNSLQ